MITKVKMPKLIENDEEQLVTAWLKQVGDPVRRGEPLIEVATSKAAFQVEAMGARASAHYERYSEGWR